MNGHPVCINAYELTFQPCNRTESNPVSDLSYKQNMMLYWDTVMTIDCTSISDHRASPERTTICTSRSGRSSTPRARSTWSTSEQHRLCFNKFNSDCQKIGTRLCDRATRGGGEFTQPNLCIFCNFFEVHSCRAVSASEHAFLAREKSR